MRRQTRRERAWRIVSAIAKPLGRRARAIPSVAEACNHCGEGTADVCACPWNVALSLSARLSVLSRVARSPIVQWKCDRGGRGQAGGWRMSTVTDLRQSDSKGEGCAGMQRCQFVRPGKAPRHGPPSMPCPACPDAKASGRSYPYFWRFASSSL